MKDILVTKTSHVYYIPCFLDDAHDVFLELLQKVGWRQDTLTLYGREIKVPRKQAWYGEAHCAYSYSGIDLAPLPFFAGLELLRKQVEQEVGGSFNCALVNQYQNGKDYVSWHSDDEPELGKNPTIASISLGHTRMFHLRNKTTGKTLKISLEHGSLLVMKGAVQHEYIHQLAKTMKPVGPRINVTFRYIAPRKG